MDNRGRASTQWLVLAGFCGFLFYFGLGAFGLLGADEPRYAQIAREMLERHDWITPVLYGEPWLEKPVLYYWQAILSYKIFGVSDWAARLPSAVDTTGMIVAVYLFCRRFRPGFQLDAALITASAAGIVGFARGAGTDMLLAATFVIAMLAWLAWYQVGRRVWLLVFFLFLALATLAKGPVAIVLAGLIISIFSLMRREVSLFRRTFWVPGILLFLAVALPWYVAVTVRNRQFFRVFILEHNFARFASNLYRHEQPFWYFLPVLVLAMVPWTVLIMAGVIHTIRNWRTAGSPELAVDSFFVVWAGVVLVLFSASRSKLPGYILPAVPACTLIVVNYLRRMILSAVRPSPGWIVMHSAVASSLPGLALLVPYLLLRSPAPGRPMALAAVISAVFFVAIPVTVLKCGLRVLRFVTLVPVIFTVAVLVRFGGPVLDSTQSARLVARDLASMESTRLPVAIYGASRQTEYGLAFYRNQQVARYERGQVPASEHLLVAPAGSKPQFTRLLPGRRVSPLGSMDAQHLEYYWVTAAGTAATR
jgi:4-amino-4-deoxy-L-arabinose transferase-like glycosyltransferase